MAQHNPLTEFAEKIRFQLEERQVLTKPRERATPAPRVSRRVQPEQRPVRKPRRSAPVTNRTYEQRAAPPVMVRGGVELLFPTRQAGRSKARKRLDVPLGMPGVEMQLPALPAIQFDIRWVAGLLSAVLVALLVYFWNAPAYRVDAVQIIGLQRLSAYDINELLGVRGELIFNLDPSQIEQRLREAFPEFISVRASVGLPNLVTVQVAERQPLLTWKQDGRTTLVDAAGMPFPLRDGGEVQTQAIIEALSPPPSVITQDIPAGLAPFMPIEMVTGILSMSAQAPPNTPLIYDARHGLGWKDAQGWEAYFGSVQDIEMKLRIYQALVKKLKQDDLNPALISVEYVHAPYYRLER
jgi:hypothetical protein